MRIPKFEMMVDVSKCVCVVDGELELTSPSVLEELSKQIGLEVEHVYLAIHTDLAEPGLVVYYYGFDPDNDFLCINAQFTDAELDYLDGLYE